MTTPGHNLDSLTDEELLALRGVFRSLWDRVPPNALRSVAACLNELDERLSKRGRLNLHTGELT